MPNMSDAMKKTKESIEVNEKKITALRLKMERLVEYKPATNPGKNASAKGIDSLHSLITNHEEAIADLMVQLETQTVEHLMSDDYLDGPDAAIEKAS